MFSLMRVDLVIDDTEKAKELIEFFSQTTKKTAPKSLPIGDWEGGKPAVGMQQTKNYFKKLSVFIIMC